MEKTTGYLERGDWRQALVRLWTLADHATLSQWETLFSARQLANQVAAFQTRLLEETPPIKPDDIAANPLALIQALDYVVATQFADMPFSAVPYAEDGKTFWLLPTPPTQVERARRPQQSGSLRHFSRHHVVVPCRVGDIDIMVTVATGQLHSSLARMAQQNVSALRCWVAHFDDGCEIQWQPHGAAKRLLASAIAPTEIRTQSALAMLASANGTSASVVVAPELTLDLAHRDAMGRWIWNQPTAHRPLLVLPGSWHEFHNGEVFNCAPLMDGTRWEPLFSHRKLTAYGTYGDGGTEDLIEAIHVGAALHVLVTPIGTFTVLVCKDFIDVDAQLRSLLQVVPVNWVLVPSYGEEKTTRAHRQRAREVSKVEVGCHVVVATIRNLPLTTGVPLPGFVHLGGADQPIEVPVGGGPVDLPIEPRNLASPRLRMVEDPLK